MKNHRWTSCKRHANGHKGDHEHGVAQLVVDENSTHKTNINNMTLLKICHFKNKGMKKGLIFSGVHITRCSLFN